MFPLPTQNQPEKAKCVPLSNYIGHLLLVIVGQRGDKSVPRLPEGSATRSVDRYWRKERSIDQQSFRKR